MSALRNRFGDAGLGAFALILSIVVMLFWYLGYAQNVLEGQGREVTAEFASTQQLQQGDLVKVDGRDEGRVRKIENLPGERGARVTFDVKDDAGPLYRDAEVQLRWKSLLGGSFYLEVDRGTSQAGSLNGTIPREQTREQVEVDDITTIFQDGARTGLTELPDELSRALRDPGSLAGLLDQTQSDSPALARGLRGVRGRDQDVDLRNVITGTAATTSALDAPRDELRALVAGAAATLGTTAGRDDELRQTLQLGPAVTQDVRATLARLDDTLAGADGLVAKLQRSAGDLDPTLAALRPTLVSTAKLVERARPLVRALRPTARSLGVLGRSGKTVLDGLQPSLDRLDHKILPFMSRKDPGTGKPTSAMIGGTAAGFGGAASQQDGNGHFIRFPASIGSENVYLPCKTALVDPTAKQLVACDAFEDAFQRYLQYVPKLSESPRRSR